MNTKRSHCAEAMARKQKLWPRESWRRCM